MQPCLHNKSDKEQQVPLFTIENMMKTHLLAFAELIYDVTGDVKRGGHCNVWLEKGAPGP